MANVNLFGNNPQLHNSKNSTKSSKFKQPTLQIQGQYRVSSQNIPLVKPIQHLLGQVYIVILSIKIDCSFS